MQSFPLTSIATLAAIGVFFWTIVLAGNARKKYGIIAPATSGHETFERCLRVQMNTLEQMAIFLPALWLCALWVGDLYGAIGGAVWAVGRILYGVAYVGDPAKRGPGFMIGMIASFAMAVASVIQIAKGFL